MWTSLLSVVLVINELMASNAGSVMSPAMNFDSWVEFYNPTEQTINLSGMYLSNDVDSLKYWQMPADVGSVPAKGFLVIWLGSNGIKSNQAPFKLDCDGGSIFLSDKNGELISNMTYPTSMSRTAYARTTDGGEEWGWTAKPTPGASNATSVFATERLEAPVVSQGSQLFTGTLNVRVDIPEGATLMYTTDGSLPVAPSEVSPWKQWVTNGSCEGGDASCFVSRDGDGNGDVNRITDGAGYQGSRGIKVHSVAGAANDWTTQFFVYTPDHVWSTGERYRFHMRVRADKPVTISVQAHKTPGDHITNNMLAGNYAVGTEWTEISYEGTLTAEQAGEKQEGGWGGWGGWDDPIITYSLQTLAFNLNKQKDADNNFYFDDISWESLDTSISTMASEDGVFTIDRTTTLCVRLFQDGYLPSVPVTRSYIQTSNKYTLPVISIVGDEKYFTDPKIGIDCDGDGTNGAVASYTNNQKRNYAQDWDRPVNMSYLSPDGQMLHNQDVNIKVSGGFTRTLAFRSFKLKASKIFDGQNRFDYPFFPQKPYIRSKTLLVRNGGNDMWRDDARFMDPALETIIQRSGIDVDVQSYQPVIEYVNGKLRGVLNLREPNNDDFAYANWGYDDEELDAFENHEMKNGDDEVIRRIFELGSHINDEGAYDELKTLLDIDEFTNYMAVTFYLYNDDWPDNNIKAYRSRNNGRYRFVSFDLDYAFKACWNYSDDNPFTEFSKFKDDATAPRTNYNKDIVNLFLNLLNHDGYRRKFIDTFCIVGGSVFEPTRSSLIVDELLSNVKDMCNLMKNSGDWNLNSGHNPDRAATTIKNSLKNRSDKMTNYLKKFSYAKLSAATRQSVSLSTDADGARLMVNGINVPYAAFDGHLFAPVVLSAEAPAGYRFAGWKKDGAIVSTEAAFSLPADNSVSLTALFTPLTDEERTAGSITPVRINEVSAANEIYVNDYFKRNDWVELYNTTDAPVDVAGMYLTDNLKKPQKYQIVKTEGVQTVIPAHGYLVVWCDKLDPLSQLHASFKLAAEGGDLLLTAADESWSDQFTYPAHIGDQTVGRYPDGSGQLYVMNVPSIDKANVISSYAVDFTGVDPAGICDLAADETGLSVRYAAGRLVVRGAASVANARLELCNLSGQMLSMHSLSLTNGSAEQSVDQLPSGYYIARVSDGSGHVTTCKFVKP